MLPPLPPAVTKLSTINWTVAENKTFEIALAQHFHDQDKWEKIAAHTSKTLDEVKSAYAILEDDMRRIYQKMPFQHGLCSASARGEPAPKRVKTKPTAVMESEHRKGLSWTQDEHRLFLLGLARFGKGCWRSIAKEFVMTRTPTQVASHAQKYFLRLTTVNDKKEKRRASIHDMTTDMFAAPLPAPVCCN